MDSPDRDRIQSALWTNYVDDGFVKGLRRFVAERIGPRADGIDREDVCPVATQVASSSTQMCGAYGIMRNLPFGRYLRDAKAYEVAGGSSEILKDAIAKSLLQLARS